MPAGAALDGELAGYVIECPLHYACFDVRTGKLLSGPVSATCRPIRFASKETRCTLSA